jgi:hypothetical protein
LISSFDEAWKAVAIPRGGEPVSPELLPLLSEAYAEYLARPLDSAALKKGLVKLLDS